MGGAGLTALARWFVRCLWSEEDMRRETKGTNVVDC